MGFYKGKPIKMPIFLEFYKGKPIKMSIFWILKGKTYKNAKFLGFCKEKPIKIQNYWEKFLTGSRKGSNLPMKKESF